MKEKFEHMKISRKLAVGFLMIAVLGMVIGIVGILSLVNIGKHQDVAYNKRTLGIVYAGEANEHLLNAKVAVRDMYIHYGGSDRQDYYQTISTELASVKTVLEKYKGTVIDSQDQKNYEAAETAFASYEKLVNGTVEAAKTDAPASEILTLMIQAKPKVAATSAAFGKAVENSTSDAAAAVKTDKENTRILIGVIIAVMAVAFIFSQLLSRFISGMISRPMQKFAEFAGLVAVGDMDVTKVVDEKDRLWAMRKDEVGALAVAFDKMISSTVEQAEETKAIASGDLTTVIAVRSDNDVMGKALTELVAKFHTLAKSIVISANEVDNGAKQIASSSIALSQGATEQASSIEELAASVEEVTSQTEENTKNAQKTNGLAENIQTDAGVGNRQMAEMLNAMEEINTSSDSISKIIKVIQDIAFQTNILALNAAVEAARAGEHGKGFAVVADEVRNLAAKSAEAAKDTTVLIEESVHKVQVGTGIANETAEALGKIVSGISEVGDLIHSITQASEEQTAALEQINQGIMQISQVVQNNAASAEESSAASEELSSQAESLKEYVSIFRLGTDE